MDEEDLYTILNVDKSSTIDDIKKQYKILAMKFHPDRNDGNDEKFKKITNAYEILSDEKKKTLYDQEQYASIDIHEFFGDLFTHVEQQKIIIRLEFNEILYGCYKEYTTKTHQDCYECEGTGISNPKKNVIQCRECFGKGSHPMVPFLSCISCNGRGIFILNHNICKICEGNRYISTSKQHKIYLKPGIEHNEIINISHNTILIIEHNYNFHDNLKIVGNNIHLTLKISLIELLCGFQKSIDIGHEKIVFISDKVFDINKNKTIPKLGIMNKGDLIVSFQLTIDTEDKIMQRLGHGLSKLLKLDNSLNETHSSNTINIHKY